MNRRRVTAAATAAIAVALIATGCTAKTAGRSDTDPADTITHTSGLVQPGAVHIGHSTVAEARAIVLRAQQLYTFWNTGDTAWLDRAVDKSFQDRTLPAGRPQGPSGPAFASKGFRAAVPDLQCQLNDLYVTGDTFTARLTFTGHFTGTSGDVRGTGQNIKSGAIDIQRVGASGKIIEDWHLEDNLTFQQQAELVPTPAS